MVEGLILGSDSISLSDAERKMLDYARKLTLTPRDMTQGDVIALREADFSDSAILSINAAVAYMNFVNRVAHGLGVELEGQLSAFTR